MNPRRLASALFVLTAFFGELHPQEAKCEEAYPIKFRLSQVGDQKNIQETTSISIKVLRARVDGEEIPGFAELPISKDFEKEASSKKQIEVFRETVLKVEESRVITRKRRYQKIQPFLDEFPVEHLLDQDVVIDTTGGDVSCYEEDCPEYLGDDAAWVQKKFRSAVSLPENFGFPEVPVKINEPWNIDCRELALQHANSLQPEIVIDPEKSRGTGVLKRVYKRGSVVYGVIRFKFQMPCDQPDEPQQVERLQPYGQPVDDAGGFNRTPSTFPTSKSTPQSYDAPQFDVKPSVKELPEVESDQKRRTSTKPPTTDLDEHIVNAGKLQEISKAKVIPKFVVLEMTLDVPIEGSAGAGQVESKIQLPTKKISNIGELTVVIEMEATIVNNEK
ncbi:MAG: hypothetical protein WCJ09_02200 [Planctomycetota bacterium]